MEDKIGMYTKQEIFDFMTNCEGSMLGHSMYDAIMNELSKANDKLKKIEKIIEYIDYVDTEWAIGQLADKILSIIKGEEE